MLNLKRFAPLFVKNSVKWMRSRVSQVPTTRRVRILLRANLPIWLDIGSGGRRGEGGWTTLDQSLACDLCWNLSRGLPFPDNSIERIYCSHTFEHFSPRELQILLAECKRVLVAGGVMSVAVPDARIWIGAYARREAVDSRKILNGYKIPCPYGRLDLVNYIAYMDGQHKYLFDDENLLNVLLIAGFRDAQLRSFDPTLDIAARQLESIYAQCCK